MTQDNRSCPYSSVPATSLWKAAVGAHPASQISPFVAATPFIAAQTRVASAGSCFAQHISRYLQGWGYNYVVSEPGPSWLSPATRASLGYGTFSARYGNIYTARQLLQLVERAYGRFTPDEPVWRRDDGGYGDPFRPRVEPEGFASVAECIRDRDRHLASVRELFETTEVLVFTLGLTEGWRTTGDGAMLPVCPGCGAGGTFDPERYGFVNFTVAEVLADLEAFCDRFAQINPQARLILTVSPVPLVATFENAHVLEATVYSKSVLRVAAETVVRQRANVHYFASYEMVTMAGTPDAFLPDRRSVAEATVANVMRVFAEQFCQDSTLGQRQGMGGETSQTVAEVSAGRTSLERDGADDAAALGGPASGGMNNPQASQYAHEVVCDEDALLDAIAHDPAVDATRGPAHEGGGA